MNSFNAKLLQGTVCFSGLFLGICLLVVFLLPAENKNNADSLKGTEFTSFTALDSFSGEWLSEVNFKNDFSSDYSSENDKGLALYREPVSRPIVEWFYTHITNNREVTVAILENAEKNDVPLALAFSLAYVESNYKPTAVNKNTNHTIDRGLFQLNSSSFPKLSEEEFFDPNVSAKYGMGHLRYCMDVAGNDITALAMYNAGTSRVKANKTPQHTLNYVAKISNYRSQLEAKFENDVLSFYQSPNKNSNSLSTKAIALANRF